MDTGVIKVAEGLKKIVDTKNFLLLLTLGLYVDIMCMNAGVNPHYVKLDSALQLLRSASIFRIYIISALYIFLMVAFFPGLRVVIGIGRVGLCDKIFRTKTDVRMNRSVSERKFSDWSLSVIALSAWDGVLGLCAPETAYHGFVCWLIDLRVWRTNVFPYDFIRAGLIIFVVVLVAFACEVDG